MRLYDDDGEGKLNQIQLCQALEALKYLHNIEESAAELNMLATMLFDEFYDPTEENITLTYNSIEKKLVKTSVLEEYLLLAKKADEVRTNESVPPTQPVKSNFMRRYSVAF